MKKDLLKISEMLKSQSEEISRINELLKNQNEQIAELKKQIEAVGTVKIEENGKQVVESFGNILYDEILALKKKLEGFSAEGLRNMINEVALLKNKIEDEVDSPDFSLAELKDDLLKLADMMSV